MITVAYLPSHNRYTSDPSISGCKEYIIWNEQIMISKQTQIPMQIVGAVFCFVLFWVFLPTGHLIETRGSYQDSNPTESSTKAFRVGVFLFHSFIVSCFILAEGMRAHKRIFVYEWKVRVFFFLFCLSPVFRHKYFIFLYRLAQKS